MSTHRAKPIMNPKQLAEAGKPTNPDADIDTPETAEAESEHEGMEDCVPLTSLAMPDENEQMQQPAVGDRVQYNVEGEITRIEGDNAYVNKTAVNGQTIEASKPETTDEMANLESMAKSMPES